MPGRMIKDGKPKARRLVAQVSGFQVFFRCNGQGLGFRELGLRVWGLGFQGLGLNF